MHERKAASHLSKLHNVAIHLWPAADVRPVFFGSDKRHRTGNAYVLYWNTVCVTATKTLSNFLPTLFGSYTLTAQLRLCQTGWAAPKAQVGPKENTVSSFVQQKSTSSKIVATVCNVTIICTPNFKDSLAECGCSHVRFYWAPDLIKWRSVNASRVGCKAGSRDWAGE